MQASENEHSPGAAVPSELNLRSTLRRTLRSAFEKELAAQQIGGALRCVFEDYLKRVAEELRFAVPYSRYGRHTSADFASAGIQREIRKKLIRAAPQNEAEIDDAMTHVFDAEMINALSHHGERRLEVPLPQVVDFVASLKSLCTASEHAGIMRGPAA